MGLVECASGQSTWRGYEYYEGKRVSNLTEIDTGLWKASVHGSQIYQTTIDVNHPRRSSCDCPLAKGRRIVCKHMIATFFTAYPMEAENYYNNVLKSWEEAESREAEIEDRMIQHVNSLKKQELCSLVLYLLDEVPDWVRKAFIRDNGLDEE